MASRKRGRAEMEAPAAVKAPGLLSQLRNMWEFANIMQFIYIFGKTFKIDDDFDIEDLEDECMKPESSHKLADIGLCILKFLSSQRGLTPELFDEHTSRQYKRRLPDNNPFDGADEVPKRFLDFDVFTKLRILFQLSQWVFLFPDRLREKMSETKDADQISWRIEEIGYDREDRLYFVLDDNRLYRRTDPEIPPPPAPKPKSKSKSKAPINKGRVGARSSKRRKTAEQEEMAPEEDEIEEMEVLREQTTTPGFGNHKWECLAVTLTDYQEFLETIKKTKDADEKYLYQAITKDVLPVIENLEEARQKKVARRQRELENMEKMAHAKRSSRIASKYDREQQEAEARATELKRRQDLISAKKDAERQKQMEEARESRMQTREQRLKEREYKRLLHEEELANLSEDSKKLGTGEARLSERHLKAEMAKKQKQLEELQEEEEWIFDCAKCGVHGENIDDGSHSIACDKCNVWQHSACLGVSQVEAEKVDFQFVCKGCIRREEDAKKPKIPSLKFKVGHSSSPPSLPANQAAVAVTKPGGSTSAPSEATSHKRKSPDLDTPTPGMPPTKKWKPVGPPKEANGAPAMFNSTSHGDSMHQVFMHGPTLAPQGQLAPTNGLNGTQAVPPGLLSPKRLTTQVNGGYVGLNLSSGHGTTNQHANEQGSTAPKSDMSSSPPTSQGFHHTTQPNPYRSSFDQQTPRAQIPSSGFTTPLHNGSSKSPFQSPYLNTPSTNFPPSSVAAPTLQPGFSPQKPMQSSPANSVAYSPSLQGSSSPKMAPPPINKHESGLSPLKHSPPRPASSDSLGENTVPPPVQQLSPSTQHQG